MYELLIQLVWSDNSTQIVEGGVWPSYDSCVLAGNIIANTLGMMLNATQFRMVCEIPGTLM